MQIPLRILLKNNRSNLLLSLLLIIGMTSCKKNIIDVPPSEVGEPVFRTSFQLEGTPQEMIAGDDEYFMFTEFTKDTDDIHTFIGSFANENCTSNCESSLQFEIRDFEPATGSTNGIDNTLAASALRFKDETIPEADVYQVELKGEVENEDEVEETRLDFGDNIGFALNRSEVIVNYIYDSTIGQVVPSFNVTEKNENQVYHAMTLDYFNDKTYSADFSVTDLGNGQYELTASANQDVVEYYWNFIYTGQSVTLDEAELLADGEIELFVEYVDNPTFASFYRRTFKLENNTLSYASTNLDAKVLRRLEGGSKLQLSTFAIQYIDENGTIYRSDLQEQSNDAYFRILSTEEYLNNSNGEKTKKLEVEYDCKLFAADGSELRVQNGQGIIGIAYSK